jgi:type IV secretion/conjugal transfer VirB4 family ATPase
MILKQVDKIKNMLPDLIHPDVISAFNGISSFHKVVSIMGFILAAVGAAAITVPAIARFVLPQPKETRLADVLPFNEVLADGSTIVCHDGTILKLLEMKGLDDTFFSPNERDMLFLNRKDWLDNMSETGVVVRCYTIREHQDVTPPTTHTQLVLREIAYRWNENFHRAYRSRQIMLIALPKGKNTQQKLEDVVDTTTTILNKYRPRVLSQFDPDPERRPLSVIGRIISPISKPNVNGIGKGINEAICGDQIEFDGKNGLITFTHGDKKAYCATIGIRSFGDYTYEAFIANLSGINGEIIIHHAINPWSKTKAAFQVGQQYRLSLAQRLNPQNARQFEEALNRIEGNDESAQSMAEYSLTIFAFAKTTEELNVIEKEIKQIATNYGIIPVRESSTSQASWFSQFPGYQLWPRPYRFFSRNIAAHITMDSPPKGLENSDWGEGPIATFKTASGTPYAFQFHISDDKAAVAHAVAIGPTGSGKTTLINFMTGMAMRHDKLRSYMIDRHGGAYIFTNSIGGNYITFEGSELEGNESAMNPFQLADSIENRSFLRSFLEALGEKQDDESVEEIGFAVEASFKWLENKDRSLTNIYDACFAKDKPLRKSLYKWVDPAVYGNIFNSAQDNLDLSSKRLVTFDFTRIYEHDDLARAVILYLMHRIQNTISEYKSPALIFIDETEPIVKHPIFRNYFMQMLQEYRKRRAAVISAFQRPEAIMKAGLGEAIRGQAQTIFFYKNPQATEIEYKDWGLTDREWAYIKGKLPIAKRLKHSVLLKRATGESIILDTDLTNLGRMIKVYYADETSRGLAESLKRETGPEWLNIYLDQA